MNINRNRKAVLISLLAILVFAISILPGCSKKTETETSESGYKHVELEEAKKLIDTEGSLLVDVRGKDVFEYEHIPGAINVSYEDVSDDPNELVKKLPDKDQLIVLYCDYGGISKEVAEKLVNKGYTNVVEFDGLLVWDGEVYEKK